MPFVGIEYQKSALIEELLEIERHSKDGSAVNAHCSCIQDKHMRLVKGLSAEAISLTTDKNLQVFFNNLSIYAENRLQSIFNLIKSNPSKAEETEFYNNLSVETREWRLMISEEVFKIPNISAPLACGCQYCVPCSEKHIH